MMKFMRKSKGSISIFLCLVLLPMVTYATLVIDATRLQSARTTIAEAGDLTMNAALSEYEQVLEDMYGLFAEVQSEDDLEPALNAYFQQTIESSLSESEDDAYIQELASWITDSLLNQNDGNIDFTNLVDMEMEELTFEPAPTSALANPAVMKRQIIDYMKYKGPVSLANTLFPKLNFLKNTSKQADAVKEKVNYTKALSDIEDPCKRAYYAMAGKDEVDSAGKVKSHENGYNDYVDEYNKKIAAKSFDNVIKDSKKYYEYVSRAILYNVKSPFQESLTYDKIYNKIKDGIKNYDDIDTMSADDLGQAESKLNRILGEAAKIIAFKSEDPAGAFENDFGGISYHYNGDEPYSSTVSFDMGFTKADYPTYKNMDTWIVELNLFQSMTELDGGNDWYIKKLKTDDAKFTEALDDRYEDQVEANNRMDQIGKFVEYMEEYKELKRLSSDVWNIYDGYYTDDLREFYAYLDDPAVEDELIEADKAADENYQRLKQYTILIELIYDKLEDKYKSMFNHFLSALSDNTIYEEAAKYYSKLAWKELNEYYKAVVECEKYAGTAADSMVEVVERIGDSEKAKEQWGTTINDIDEGATKAGMKSDFDTVTDGLSMEDAEKLRDVAQECHTYFSDLKSALESIKFFSTQLLSSSVTSAPYFDNEKEYKNHGSDTKPIKTIATDIVSANFHLNSFDPAKAVKANKLDGRDDDGNNIDEEKFFYTLKSICEAKKTQIDEETENAMDVVNEYAEVDSDGGAKKVDTSKHDDDDEPDGDEPDGDDGNGDDDGDDDGDDEELETEDFDQILQSIQNYCEENDKSNNPPEMGDNTVNGMKIDMNNSDYGDASNDAMESLSAASSILSKFSDMATTVRDYAYMEEYFTEMFTCQTDPLDEELVLLNGYGISGDGSTINTGTEWYGKEIEYIIWGDPNMQNNLIKNEAMIYTIRFALNAIYAFTAADIQSFALEVATAIAGWTVIGVPIVQACVTIAIALAESAFDLHELKQGKDVPIYKNASNFVCSPTGFLKNVTEKTVHDAIDGISSKIEESLNEKIDEISETTYTTIGQATKEVQGFVDEFMNEQQQNITSMVENNFINPIINKVTPVLTMVNGEVDDIKNQVTQGINEAFEAIESNIEKMDEGPVRDLTSTLYTTAAIPQKDDLINRLTQYLTEVQENNSASVENIRVLLTGDVNNGDSEDGVITEWMDRIKQQIDDKMTELNEEMMSKIKEHGEEAIGNLKSVIHDEMEAVSNKVSGVTDDIMSKIDTNKIDIPKDTTSGSGGFTLNYKEYCKIFVLLNIVADQTKMLQRAGALIQANVCHAAENANESFELTNANTLVYVNAKVKLGTMFPWCVSVTDNNATGEMGTQLDLSHLGSNYVTIDYSGINGY